MKRWRSIILVVLALAALIATLPLYDILVEQAAIRAAAKVKAGMTRMQVQDILGRPRQSGMGFSTNPGSSRLWDQDCFGGPMTMLKRKIDLWLWKSGRDRWRDTLKTCGRQSDWAVIVVYDEHGNVHMVVTRGKTIEPVGEADPFELF